MAVKFQDLYVSYTQYLYDREKQIRESRIGLVLSQAQLNEIADIQVKKAELAVQALRQIPFKRENFDFIVSDKTKDYCLIEVPSSIRRNECTTEALRQYCIKEGLTFGFITFDNVRWYINLGPNLIMDNRLADAISDIELNR
jgi:hypothetical protein